MLETPFLYSCAIPQGSSHIQISVETCHRIGILLRVLLAVPRGGAAEEGNFVLHGPPRLKSKRIKDKLDTIDCKAREFSGSA